MFNMLKLHLYTTRLTEIKEVGICVKQSRHLVKDTQTQHAEITGVPRFFHAQDNIFTLDAWNLLLQAPDNRTKLRNFPESVFFPVNRKIMLTAVVFAGETDSSESEMSTVEH